MKRYEKYDGINLLYLIYCLKYYHNINSTVFGDEVRIRKSQYKAQQTEVTSNVVEFEMYYLEE